MLLCNWSDKNVKDFISDFKCSQNQDIENFLKSTSIRFEEADKSRTYLVIPKDDKFKIKDNKLVILGYFTLGMKHINIGEGVSKSQIKRLDGFKKDATSLNCYLIGQLAKNDLYQENIEGYEVLEYAINTLKECYSLIGGRVVLVECEDTPKLIKFYKDNHFIRLQKDMNTNYVQMVLTLQSSVKEQIEKSVLFKNIEGAKERVPQST
ncbi:acetyltransferase [Clostridium botulinum]